MCGIAGIYNYNNKEPESTLLQALQKSISHRGPDGAGIYQDQNIGFVHTRLSIQDLSSAAHQPMLDETASYCLTFNGEIYNFKSIREELESKGIKFTSTGDTEVLLKSCIHFGVEKTLTSLNGMFAFSFWDVKKKEMWIARDRMGIKPLYYQQSSESIIFASEMGPILSVGQRSEPDKAVLFEFLAGGTNWEPNTLFSNVKALSPGSFMHIKPNSKELIQKEYYSSYSLVDQQLYQDLDDSNIDDVSKHFESLLRESIKIHSVSDAPVATLVSGGIDSSLISAITKEHIDNLGLYHADVVGENSEKVYAKQVADHLDLKFVCAEMTHEFYVEELVETTFFHEAPSAYHPNDVPFQLIAKKAHEDGIKVLLTGEGADELFIGYGLASKEIVRDKINATLSMFPGSSKIQSLITKLYPPRRKNTMVQTLSTRGVSQSHLERAQQAYSFINDPVEKSALLSSSMYQKAHLNSLLQRNDRMGMMHGLESRIPFLENEIVKFAVNLPVKYKHPKSWMSILKGNPMTNNKTVVRNAANNILPSNIVKRKKVGFPITPETYINLNPEFFKQGFLEDYLEIKHTDMSSIFNSLDSDTKWNLFSTELFGKLFFQGQDRNNLKDTIMSYAVK